MINKLLIVFSLTFCFSNQGTACSCKFTSHEFSIHQYDGATHIFIAEVKEKNPQNIITEKQKASLLKDSKKQVNLNFTTYYSLEIHEVFKGDLLNLAYIETENITSCSGERLTIGVKYLFYMYSTNQQPTFFMYNSCTPIEEVKFNSDMDIPKKKENIKSLVQQHNIQILRELREIKNDTITTYFSGYVIENDSLKKEEQKVNFRGKFKKGKRSGRWEIYQPRTDAVFEKRKDLFDKPIIFGYYHNGVKTGVWSKYAYKANEEKWVLTLEYFGE